MPLFDKNQDVLDQFEDFQSELESKYKTNADRTKVRCVLILCNSETVVNAVPEFIEVLAQETRTLPEGVDDLSVNARLRIIKDTVRACNKAFGEHTYFLVLVNPPTEVLMSKYDLYNYPVRIGKANAEGLLVSCFDAQVG